MSNETTFPGKPNALVEIFGDKQKPVIGTIHLKPLPGAPRYDGNGLNSVIDSALEDATRYLEGGVDGLIVENAWDLPFLKPSEVAVETVAALTRLTRLIVRHMGLPTGVNCLANAVVPALAVAHCSGALFVRSNQWVNAYVANEGLVEGASAEALRYRSKIRANHIKIFADVHVKHGSHSIVADRSLAEQTRDAVFFDADVLIGTGNRTGHGTPLEEVKGIKDNTRLPVIIGSGLTDKNTAELFRIADGAIVGTFMKEKGLWWNPVDVDRVKSVVAEAARLSSRRMDAVT